jgi:hypothetical protein
MSGTKFIGDVSKKLNVLAREQMKTKLLADILVDMKICKLEGWNATEYITEIIDMLKKYTNKGGE